MLSDGGDRGLHLMLPEYFEVLMSIPSIIYASLLSVLVIGRHVCPEQDY